MQDKLINLSHLSTGLEDLIQKANDLIRTAKAPSTRKAYQSDFRIFESWCAAHELASLPSSPQTIALYIASCVVARPQRPRWDGNTSCIERILRTRYRENHSSPFASSFAALHPAGRDVPRECKREPRPLASGPGKSPLNVS